MADDYTNTTNTTGRIVPGASVPATFETVGDMDWFAISLVAGYQYQFTISATTSTVNPTGLNVALLNNSGGVVTGSQNNYASTKSVAFTPTTSGTYYVDAQSYAGQSTGPYLLTAAAVDDFTETLATTGQIAPGSTITAGLQATGDNDWFAISLQGGYNYQFSVSGMTDTINPTGLNVALLNNTAGVVAGSRNTYASNSAVTFTPTSNGIYYVDVGSSSGDSAGTYQLVASPQDDFAASGATNGHLTGNSITGKLEGADDVDWISVSLNAGSTYGFTIAATPDTVNPTGLNVSILNASGINVAGSSSTYASSKSVTYTPTVSGTYYLRATSSRGASLGTHTISSNTTGTGAGTGTTGGSSVVPVYRFFDSSTGTQFLTSSASERDSVLATRSDLKSEGVGLNATASTDPNASAVYRFFDKVYGTHFFTSSSAERDTIQATRSDLSYEGAGFYEYANQQAGTTAVYRFFDTNKGTHFFTSNAAERANIIATRADLTPEGISFYSPT